MKEAEMRRIAKLIDVTLQSPEDADVSKRVREEVRELTSAFPLYPEPVEAASPQSGVGSA
jgi:glycine/serine hydroxymethyltransferase